MQNFLGSLRCKLQFHGTAPRWIKETGIVLNHQNCRLGFGCRGMNCESYFAPSLVRQGLVNHLAKFVSPVPSFGQKHKALIRNRKGSALMKPPPPR